MSKLHCWLQRADSLLEETHTYETRSMRCDTHTWCDTHAGSAKEGVNPGYDLSEEAAFELDLKGKVSRTVLPVDDWGWGVGVGVGLEGEFPAEATNSWKRACAEEVKRMVWVSVSKSPQECFCFINDDNTRRSHNSGEEKESRDCLREAGGVCRRCQFKGKL